jgi:hypothetical protein
MVNALLHREALPVWHAGRRQLSVAEVGFRSAEKIDGRIGVAQPELLFSGSQESDRT